MMEILNVVNVYGLDKPEKKKKYIDDKEFMTEVSKLIEKVHYVLSKVEPVIAKDLFFDLSMGKKTIHISIAKKSNCEFASRECSIDDFIPQLSALMDTDVENAIKLVKEGLNIDGIVKQLLNAFKSPCVIELLAAYNELYENECFKGHDMNRPLIEENHGAYYIYSAAETLYTETTGELSVKMETPLLRIQLEGFNPEGFVDKSISERYNYVIHQIRNNPSFKTISTFYA